VRDGHGLGQKVLIATQIALTLALVVGSGLFGSSLRWLYGLDLGVKSERVWDARLVSRPEGYGSSAPGAYYRDLLRQVETIPGVTAAVLADFVPYYNAMSQQPVAAAAASDPGQQVQAHVCRVTDGLFSLMGMRIEDGADFRRDEADAAGRDAIVSQSLAERLGGPHAALGRRIRVGTAPDYQSLKVVGIVSDAQFDLVDPSQSRPLTVYIDAWQHPLEQAGYPVLLLKTAGASLPTSMLRQVVDRAGREYVERVRTVDAEKDGALVENRVLAYLAGAFGMVALALAATGLFGLLSYHVDNRTGEIGIRMALGAWRGRVIWMVMRQVMAMAIAGLAIGAPIAYASSRLVESFLFGVKPNDPASLAAAIATLVIAALVAGYAPARRASRIDPMAALRHE